MPPVTPAVQGTWPYAANALVRGMSPAKGDAAASNTGQTAPGGQLSLVYRFVSPPLAAAVAISGTATVDVYASPAAGGNGFAHLWVWRPDLPATPRGTLLTTGSAGFSVPFSAAHATGSPVTLTAVNALAGDRIVAELGAGGSAGGSVTPTFWRGGTGADGAAGSTDANRPGWIEFSATLLFSEGTPVRAWILE